MVEEQVGPVEVEMTNSQMSKIVSWVVGIVVSGVLYWCGTTLSQLSTRFERLSVVLETQVEKANGWDRAFETAIARISEVELEQAKRTGRVYDIEKIQADLKRVEEASLKIEKKAISDHNSHSDTLSTLRMRVNSLDKELQARTVNVYKVPTLEKTIEDILKRIGKLEDAGG